MLTGIEILIANISTTYHRGDMMNDQGIVMLCMKNVFIKLTQDARKTTFSLLTMHWVPCSCNFNHFREKGLYNPNMVCL